MANSLFKIPAALARRRLERRVKQSLPMLYRSALGLCRDPHDAEDLVHDTCVKALTAAERAPTDSESGCQAWLHKILLNTFRDQYRRTQRSPVSARSEDFDNIIEFAASRELQPDDHLTRSDFEYALDTALTRLPADVRAVTVLHVLSGFSYKEVAGIVECPVGTVMSRLARGRKALRETLRHHVEDSKEPNDEQTRTRDSRRSSD